MRSVFVGGAIDSMPGGDVQFQKVHFTDLKAIDWCYSTGSFTNNNKTYDNITFYAVVGNVGTKPVSGPGSIKTGASIGAYLYGQEKETKTMIDKYWQLQPGEISILGNGVTLQFVYDFEYSYISFIFDISGEPPTCAEDLISGKSNNGIAFFVDKTKKVVCPEFFKGEWVKPPFKFVTGKWILEESKKESYRLVYK